MRLIGKVSIFFVFVFIMFACSNSSEKMKVDLTQYKSYGDSISPTPILSAQEMQEKYSEMKVGDSIQIAFKSVVNSVCQKKGCWMKLDLPQKNKTSFVRFKDYAFFIPKDAKGTDVIVQGTAYREEVSVAELKHYAKDEGKSEAEIAAITKPQEKYTFLAKGVLLKQKKTN